VGVILDSITTTGGTSGYTCPSGYILNTCGGSYTCTKIEETDILSYKSSNNEISFDTNLSVLGEGEFLIKGYYEYPITTFTMGSLNRTYSNYPQAKKYNYNGNTDWYFINL
jgi:hypothetical protein